MKTLPKKYLFALVVFIPLLWISGCASTDEKDAEVTAVATDGKDIETAADTAKTKEPTSEQEKATKEEVTPEPPAEEPVVEVTPGAAKSTDVKVEPITKPEKQEPVADTPKTQSITESETAEEPATPKQAIPVSTGPDHFVITAARKDTSHPFYGKGHEMGFLVNNVPGKEIVLERGKTYRFDVVTDPKHDVYISLKDIGWGSVPYTKGIEGMYTYKGTIIIKPDKETPDTLYYSCRNHPYMGGKIHIVDPGETVTIAKRAAVKSTDANTKAVERTQADVNQKIMFANMLLSSKNTQAIAKSNITDAVDLYKQAEKALDSAKSQLKNGNNNDAYKSAESAIALIKKSSKLVPNESQLAHLKERNKELLVSVKDFEDSHKDNYDRILKKQGKEAAVDYDKSKVEKLKASAADYAKKGDYGKANNALEEAQHVITAAIHKMLNNQTIVYDLKFENAQEEYEYELKRFEGYYELIPIAVEQKKPAEGAKKLMESFADKGKNLRDQAVQKAKAGDFPTAIAMLQDATKDVRRGLRMIGVSQ